MNEPRLLPAAVIIGLVVVVAVGAWLIARTPGGLVDDEPPRLGAAASTGGDLVVVTVEQGDDAGAIGGKLADAGVIESARLFRVLTALMGLEDELEAGEYEFELSGTALTAIQRISQGITAPIIVRVLIREGLRKEEVALAFEEAGVVSAADFTAALADTYSTSFLAEISSDAGLEGFLFPATYPFPRHVTAHDVVGSMLVAFDERFQRSIQAGLANAGLSLREVVTLASIVEREARLPEERPVIAAVFLNRLERGMLLQTDPTVQYALGNDPQSVSQFGFWKQGLTLADLEVDSPYNTYEHAGLPPGPIANPGLASILAVLEPAETDVLFFVARCDGSHAFAETLEAHNRNVREEACN